MQGLHGKNLYFWAVPGSIIPDENEGHPGVQINRTAKKDSWRKEELIMP